MPLDPDILVARVNADCENKSQVDVPELVGQGRREVQEGLERNGRTISLDRQVFIFVFHFRFLLGFDRDERPELSIECKHQLPVDTVSCRDLFDLLVRQLTVELFLLELEVLLHFISRLGGNHVLLNETLDHFESILAGRMRIQRLVVLLSADDLWNRRLTLLEQLFTLLQAQLGSELLREPIIMLDFLVGDNHAQVRIRAELFERALLRSDRQRGG